MDQDKLVSYFRTTDESSDLVGRRQASTFQTLAALAGKTELPRKRNNTATNGEKPRRKQKESSEATPRVPKPELPAPPSQTPKGREIGLTVRIEVNLPASGDQETYDRIFRSIRENLINAS